MLSCYVQNVVQFEGQKVNYSKTNFPSNLNCEWNITDEIDGILPKGPYLPCLRMADRALLAGYPWNVVEVMHAIDVKYIKRNVYTDHTLLCVTVVWYQLNLPISFRIT